MTTPPSDPLAEIFGQPPLREQLIARFTEHPDLPALCIDSPAARRDPHWLTYGELGRQVYRTAHALTAAGATPGARVGVMLPNSEAFVRTWLALALLNATMVPINIHLVGAGLRHVLLSTDLTLLLVDAPLLPAVQQACGDEMPARTVLVWDAAAAPSPGPSPAARERGARAKAGSPDSVAAKTWRTRSTEAPLSRAAGEGPGEGAAFAPLLALAPDTPPPPVAVDPADPALIIYTSGTTGPSKGVVLSRTAQLWHALNYFRDFIQIQPGEAAYTPLPLFHVSAQGFSLGCLLNGAAIAIGARFQPFSFWDAVRRHNAKAFNYVSAMIPLLYHRRPRPDDAGNPVLRAVGSATPPELHEPFERRFGLRLIESYGQTETAGLWLTDPPEVRRIGAVGKPRRWLEAGVLREDGMPATPDETGEIVLRPVHPLLMTQGYFNDDAATARAFRSGWYWTGDAGSQDADGYLRFRGRLKDFIRRRGENISAFEIEREALTHPAVREAAAVGVPSTLGEDEVKLCVIPHEGATLDPVQLDRHLRVRLAAFMRPRYIEVRLDFPRTPTQRVQKFKLREEGIPANVWERGARGQRP